MESVEEGKEMMVMLLLILILLFWGGAVGIPLFVLIGLVALLFGSAPLSPFIFDLY